ncbi:MAG: NYN domain-containing protein [Streptosporangiaceae bacterium]
MQVGVYVDGYNLYYGARGLCGRGTAGWRWLDIRALSQRLVSQASRWQGAVISRVVYCTAVIDAATNPSGYTDQDIYLRALTTANSVDHIAYGSYVARVKYAPLAVKAASRSGRPQLVHPQWPVMVQDANGNPVPDATFMVSYAHREEKGSDVNVAAHLLVDVLTGVVDAAVVVSNDSDLEFPVSYTRTRVPVGLVNPSGNYLAGALRGQPSDGVGSHWWRQLSPADLRACQMPDPAGSLARPAGW